MVVVLGVVAKRIGIAYPIVMVLGGLLLSFVPGLPNVTLDPDLIFVVLLPPLLFAAAAGTSWREFHRYITSILVLAFGLVGFLVAAVAFVSPQLLSGFTWQMGMTLGAIVAPTDAIAATSIARRIGLPTRIVDILEGESLINDATGLLALRFATSMAMGQTVPTAFSAVSTLLWLIAGGIGVGLLVGWMVDRIENRIDDGPLEISISLLTPYAAYAAAEEIHASGVLAVVVAGLLISRRSSGFLSPTVRLQISAVWESLNFILNGLVFTLIGLQSHAIRGAIHDVSFGTLLMDGAVISVLLILFRLAWVYPSAAITHGFRRVFLSSAEPTPNRRELFVIGWTGMRGVVSLAAALALPTAFPQRNVILFLTFSVILSTLVLQGLSLPWLIGALRLTGAAEPHKQETRAARRTMIEAAISFLEAERVKSDKAEGEIYKDLLRYYKRRLTDLDPDNVDEDGVGHSHVLLKTIDVERGVAIRLRNQGSINDEVLRRLERELDLGESRLRIPR